MLNLYYSLISNRNFRHLWLGQIISQISLNMLSFVLAIWVYQQTQSNAAVSFMLLSFGIPSLLVGFIAGSIVDYLDKRKVMIYCNLSRAFILFIYFFYARNLIALFALSVIISIITQFFIPSEGPSIPSLVSPRQLLTANSLFTVSLFLSTVFGFILAGPMLKAFGENNVYLVIAFFMLVAGYFSYKLPDLKNPSGKLSHILDFTSIGKAIDEGIKFIKTHKRIKQSLILMTFSQALVATMAVLAPGFADQILKIDLTDASYLVMGPAAFGLVIGSLGVGGIGTKYLKGSIILTGTVGTGVLLILLSFITKASEPFVHFFGLSFTVNNLAVAILLIFLLGIFNSFITVPTNTILQEETHSDMRGRVYGFLTALTGGASLLPVVFSGVLADVMGVGRTLVVLGVFVLFFSMPKYLQRIRLNNNIK